MPLNLQGPELTALLEQSKNADPNPPQNPQPQPQAKKSIGKAPWLAMLAGQGADLATTLHFLKQGQHEANPIGDHPYKIAAMKGGANLAIAGLMKLLEREANKSTPMVEGQAIPDGMHKTNPNAVIHAAQGAGYGAGAYGALAALHNEFGTGVPTVFKK